MVAGVIPSPEFNEQLRTVVRQVLREIGLPQQKATGTRLRPAMWSYAIANEDIAAASDATQITSTGEVELLGRNTVTQKLERTGVKELGVNRFENISIDENALVIVTRMAGELAIVGADCAAMGSPPA